MCLRLWYSYELKEVHLHFTFRLFISPHVTSSGRANGIYGQCFTVHKLMEIKSHPSCFYCETVSWWTLTTGLLVWSPAPVPQAQPQTLTRSWWSDQHSVNSSSVWVWGPWMWTLWPGSLRDNLGEHVNEGRIRTVSTQSQCKVNFPLAPAEECSLCGGYYCCFRISLCLVTH